MRSSPTIDTGRHLPTASSAAGRRGPRGGPSPTVLQGQAWTPRRVRRTGETVNDRAGPDVERYDAVVIGAGFAGLAAAGKLSADLAGRARVLLADRRPIGAGTRSACATPLAVLERLGVQDCVEQVHHRIVLVVADREFVVTAPFPYATFDYSTFCDLLAKRLSGVEIVRATFHGVDAAGTLHLGAARVSADVLIDASGWPARVATERGGAAPRRADLGFGMEVSRAVEGEDLQFWLRPEEASDGYAWSFPAGSCTREGLGSYQGAGGGMGVRLQSWHAGRARSTDATAGPMHGGPWTTRLREPVAGPVLLVGDAAGHCLPATAEGIRPALVWGQEAGRQAARVVAREATLTAAQSAYRRQVLAHRPVYRRLRALQTTLLRLPRAALPAYVRAMTAGPVLGRAWRTYWLAADPDRLTGPWTGHVTAVGPGR